MLKKVMIMLLMVSSLFLFGCGKEENNDSNKNNITYTNKFECIREDKLTKDQIYYATKEEPLNGEKGDAVNVTYKNIYDFDEKGDKLLKYYNVTTYDYILDYDMDKQKEYYENNCNKVDKDTFKSCKVTLDNKRITVSYEINLVSETANKYLSNLTLNSVKENYAESNYTCK